MAMAEDGRGRGIPPNHRTELELRPPTYLDFLALAFAQTSSTQFSSDSSEWCKVIGEFQDDIRVTNPEFLSEVHIQGREDSNPFSDQIEAFRASMRRSGCFTVMSRSGGSKYEMLPGVKAQIREGNARKCQEKQELIAQLAVSIDSKLGLNTRPFEAY